MSLPIEHVILDLDGTLIDSRADLAAAVNHVLRTLGLEQLRPETVYRYVGNGARVLVERALGQERNELWDRGVAEFLAHYREHLLDHTHLCPGMGDVLSSLAERHVAVSVLTNKPEALSLQILDGLDVRDRLVGVIGGDTLPVRKPDPAGVFQLLRCTNTTPDRAVFVGDSSVDLQTARAAAVRFCGVGWGFNPEDLAGEGIPCVRDAGELGRLILGG
jgi:phosphoglycolate phosphatase